MGADTPLLDRVREPVVLFEGQTGEKPQVLTLSLRASELLMGEMVWLGYSGRILASVCGMRIVVDRTAPPETVFVSRETFQEMGDRANGEKQ